MREHPSTFESTRRPTLIECGPWTRRSYFCLGYPAFENNFNCPTATGDHAADRILEAVNASPNGLSRTQMSALFHGHVSSSRIDAALQQLISLGAIDQSNQPTGGRPATLWSAIPQSECLAEAESYDETTAEEKTNDESMWEQT